MQPTIQTELDELRNSHGGYSREDQFNIQDAKKTIDQDKYLRLGDKALPFTLPNVSGEKTSLSSLVEKGPVIISFFRGAWCDFCQLELKALQRSLPEFEKLNASLVGISADTISVQDITQGQLTLSYSVLSDVGCKVAQQYGLSYRPCNELLDAFAQFGMDLEVFHGVKGEDAKQFIIPATYVVDYHMNIVFSFVDPDHTKRAEPSEIIATLMSIS